MKTCMESMKLFLIAALFVTLCTAQYFSFQYTYSVKKEHHIRVESVPPNTKIQSNYRVNLEEKIGNSQDNIFFIESNDNLTEFHPRLLCAFESAAIHNPNKTIFILINKDSRLENIPNFFGGRLKNVILVRVDYAELVVNTPLAETWSKGAITTIGFYLNNISDALRVVVLWRFGGTYLDSDIISVKPVPREHQNFILCNGMGPMLLSNAILSFQRKHPFLDLTLSEQAKNFKPHAWGNLGPTRLTTCARAYCDTPSKEVLENNYCNPKSNITGAGFKVLHHSAGYGVTYPAWHKFYDITKADEVMAMTKNSFAVHY